MKIFQMIHPFIMNMMKKIKQLKGIIIKKNQEEIFRACLCINCTKMINHENYKNNEKQEPKSTIDLVQIEEYVNRQIDEVVKEFREKATIMKWRGISKSFSSKDGYGSREEADELLSS